jgi:hypothetical protein
MSPPLRPIVEEIIQQRRDHPGTKIIIGASSTQSKFFINGGAGGNTAGNVIPSRNGGIQGISGPQKARTNNSHLNEAGANSTVYHGNMKSYNVT